MVIAPTRALERSRPAGLAGGGESFKAGGSWAGGVGGAVYLGGGVGFTLHVTGCTWAVTSCQAVLNKLLEEIIPSRAKTGLNHLQRVTCYVLRAPCNSKPH